MTALEAAIVLPVFLWLIFGIIECGMIYHVSSLTNYGINEAARITKTGTYNGYATRQDMIRATVVNALGPWYSDPEKLTIRRRQYASFAAADAKEVVTKGSHGSGRICTYQVTFNWTPLTPAFAYILGDGDVISIRSTIMVKNEEF